MDSILKFDEDTVLTGSGDGMVRVVSILPNKLLAVAGEHGSDGAGISRMALSHDRRTLATVSMDPCEPAVMLWELKDLHDDDDDEEEEDDEEEAADEAGDGDGDNGGDGAPPLPLSSAVLSLLQHAHRPNCCANKLPLCCIGARAIQAWQQAVSPEAFHAPAVRISQRRCGISCTARLTRRSARQ